MFYVKLHIPSMSRNFVPTMGCFFGMAFRKYGIPLQSIIGEFMINIIFYGFIAQGTSDLICTTIKVPDKMLSQLPICPTDLEREPVPVMIQPVLRVSGARA